MTEPQPYECRWVKRKASGDHKLILQQYVPKPGYMVEVLADGTKQRGRPSGHEWMDVPVVGQPDDESTVRIVARDGSGPLDASTQPTNALEPVQRTPVELEQVIERQVLVVTALMKMRAEMPGPAYLGTLVLVHGVGKQQRMFVNGFERSMPPRSMLIVNDDDVHDFQTRTVPPAEANQLPRSPNE